MREFTIAGAVLFFVLAFFPATSLADGKTITLVCSSAILFSLSGLYRKSK